MGLYDRDYSQLEDATKEGVQSFSFKVYSWMSCGLLTTTLVAYLIFRLELSASILPFALFAGLICFGIGMAMQGLFERVSAQTLMGLMLAYSAFEGVFFGAVLPMFHVETVWSAFLVGGLMFGGAVLYGRMTRSDLTSLGSILRYALIGLLVTTLGMFVLSFLLFV